MGFFISFLDISLFAYRNKSDFCILILYPKMLLNLFVSSNSFLVETRIFYVQKAGEACHSPHSPFLGKGNSFYLGGSLLALSSAGLGGGMMQVKSSSSSFPFCMVIFRVSVPLCC